MYCPKCGSQVSENEKFCKNCGCDLIAGLSVTETPAKKKRAISPAASAAVLIVAVVCVTAAILRVFNNQVDKNDMETADMHSSINTENALAVSEPVENDPANVDVEEVQAKASDQGTKEAGYSQEDYDKAVYMADILSMEWYVKKYYDGDKWNTYELGKKMAIVAYNFLNDQTITMGGYSYLSNEKVLGVRKYEYYTYVPVKVYSYHGKDIRYSCPTIIVTDEYIDMSGMDGPVFDISEFRYENINGEDFLINDDAGFALMYDGTYLEYCEPDEYGYYQGYYAFDMFDSLVNATVEY